MSSKLPTYSSKLGQTKPKGIKLSLAVKRVSTGVGPAMQLVRIIDKIHGTDGLPTIEVCMGHPSHMEDAGAAYIIVAPGVYWLQLNPNSRRPLLGALHELGHFIDHHAFAGQDTWASTISEPLGPVMDAINASATVKFLELLKDDEVVSYMLRPQELFARAYTQYIASRTRSRTLRSQFAAWRKHHTYEEDVIWEDDEFAPIAVALHNVLAARGWLERVK